MATILVTFLRINWLNFLQFKRILFGRLRGWASWATLYPPLDRIPLKVCRFNAKQNAPVETKFSHNTDGHCSTIKDYFKGEFCLGDFVRGNFLRFPTAGDKSASGTDAQRRSGRNGMPGWPCHGTFVILAVDYHTSRWNGCDVIFVQKASASRQNVVSSAASAVAADKTSQTDRLHDIVWSRSFAFHSRRFYFRRSHTNGMKYNKNTSKNNCKMIYSVLLQYIGLRIIYVKKLQIQLLCKFVEPHFALWYDGYGHLKSNKMATVFCCLTLS